MKSLDLTLSAGGANASTITSFHATSVHVSLDPVVAGNRTYRLAYAYSLNLLARTFPGQLTFSTAIGDMPLAILSSGTIRTAPSETTADIGVAIGNRHRIYCRRLVVANCHDWHVAVDSNEGFVDPNEPWNPVLALVTACYIAARVTYIAAKGAVGGSTQFHNFSILDFRKAVVDFNWETPLDIGDVHLAGVGAIGSGFLAALSAHTAAKGQLFLVDHDVLEDGNLDRYSFFGDSDVGVAKVASAKSRIAMLVPTLKVVDVPMRLKEYFDAEYKARGTFAISSLVSAPDRRSTRREFQELLPNRIWDASTSPNEVVLHHNDFRPDLACLECIYPPNVQEDSYFRSIATTLRVPLERIMSNGLVTADEAATIVSTFPDLAGHRLAGQPFESVFKKTCSLGEFRSSPGDDPILTPFACISALAGVLLYFEFLKSLQPRIFNSYQQHNYIRLNPFFVPNPDFQEQRGPHPACACCRSPAVRAAYDRLWHQ